MSKVIEYKLHLKKSTPLSFKVNVQNDNDPGLNNKKDNLPKWTHLKNNQCSHCPLSSKVIKYCPLAVRILPFVSELSHLSSIEEISFDVIQFDQTKHMKAPAQDMLGSLLGLYMATSSCPYTQFLKPMAQFHLPLADTDETLYRVLSMYCLGQYFRKEANVEPDNGFEELQQSYDNMGVVNKMISKRIRDALVELNTSQDGTINAMVLLDALSQYVPTSTNDALDELRPLFEFYVKTQSSLNG